MAQRVAQRLGVIRTNSTSRKARQSATARSSSSCRNLPNNLSSASDRAVRAQAVLSRPSNQLIARRARLQSVDEFAFVCMLERRHIPLGIGIHLDAVIEDVFSAWSESRPPEHGASHPMARQVPGVVTSHDHANCRLARDDNPDRPQPRRFVFSHR